MLIIRLEKSDEVVFQLATCYLTTQHEPSTHRLCF